MRVALLLVLGGCDFIFRIDRVPRVDADITPSDDAIVGDVGVDHDGPPQSTACNPSEVDQILVGEFRAPAITANQLQLFVARKGLDGEVDLYVMTRQGATLPWTSGAAIVLSLTGSGDDFEPIVWSNGLRINFLSTRSGSKQFYQASRTTQADAWTSVTQIGTANLNFAAYDITPDGLTMWSDDGLNNALSRATRSTETQAFGQLSTVFSNVGAPSLTANQLVLYYHRDGIIYRATRAATTGGFGNEQMVTTGADPEISDDGTRLYYRSAAGIATIPCTP